MKRVCRPRILTIGILLLLGFRAPAVVITVNGEPKANRKQQESHEFIGVRTMLEPQRDGRSTELTVPGDLRTSQVRPG